MFRLLPVEAVPRTVVGGGKYEKSVVVNERDPVSGIEQGEAG